MDLWVGLGLNLVVLAVGAVWAIGKIKAQIAVLTESINNLNTTLIELRKWVGQIDEKVDSQGERLAKVEAKLE